MLGDAQPANAIDPRDQAVVQLFKTTQRAMERTADKLEDISVAVHTIDKRLAVIEAGSLEREIERLGEQEASVLQPVFGGCRKGAVSGWPTRRLLEPLDDHRSNPSSARPPRCPIYWG